MKDDQEMAGYKLNDGKSLCQLTLKLISILHNITTNDNTNHDDINTDDNTNQEVAGCELNDGRSPCLPPDFALLPIHLPPLSSSKT